MALPIHRSASHKNLFNKNSKKTIDKKCLVVRTHLS